MSQDMNELGISQQSTDIENELELTYINSESNIFNNSNNEGLPSCGSLCTFEWNNINVYGRKNKQILYNMNGSISSGVFMAIMGGTAAGKSTLLNALSGRTNLNQYNVTGNLSINNTQFKCTNQSIIKSLCSFVPQSDILCPTQTVSEALLFYAKLKLHTKSSEKQIKRVEYLIDALHLQECKDSVIGYNNIIAGGISGGERKRVSIAAELINDCDIIFLDEPTSGLDAYTASEIIKTLKHFCTQSSKTIISVIHQPSHETFYLFDTLILLSHGKCCFNSSLSDIDIFFKNSLKPKTNPADVIVYETQQYPNIYAAKWNESKLNLYINNFDTNINIDFNTQFKQFTHTNINTAPYIIQLQLLLKRELQSLYRDKRLTLMRLIQLIFFALCCGVIYYKIRRSFSERIACFFLMQIIVLLFGIISLLVVFPKQKILFEREYSSNTYSIICFALSFILIEIPREILHMLIFTIIAYNLIDLDANWMLYWFYLFLGSFSGGSFGMIFGVICNKPTEASQMVPAALIPIIMFCDVIVSINNLPIWLNWIATIDPLYYLLRCLMIIEFNGKIYPRHLTDEDEYICEHWNNITLFINNSIKTTETPSSFEHIGIIKVFNKNITQSTFSPSVVNEYCSTEIPSHYFFAAKQINTNNLLLYCFIVIIIAICLRIIAILILYAKNNNNKNKLIKYCCCCTIKKRNNTSNNTNISVSSGLELNLMRE